MWFAFVVVVATSKEVDVHHETTARGSTITIVVLVVDADHHGHDDDDGGHIRLSFATGSGHAHAAETRGKIQHRHVSFSLNIIVFCFFVSGLLWTCSPKCVCVCANTRIAGTQCFDGRVVISRGNCSPHYCYYCKTLSKSIRSGERAAAVVITGRAHKMAMTLNDNVTLSIVQYHSVYIINVSPCSLNCVFVFVFVSPEQIYNRWPKL